MLAVRIAEKDVDLPKLDDVINTYVPAGFNVNDEPLGNFSHLNDLVAPANISLAYCSIGSLGGGNHFIELDKDDDGNLWLVIHTGSRHLGLEVAKYYQELAYKQLKDLDVGDKIKAVIADLKAKGREKEIEKTINALKMHEPHIPKSLCYVSGQAFKDYIHDTAANIYTNQIWAYLIRNCHCRTDDASGACMAVRHDSDFRVFDVILVQQFYYLADGLIVNIVSENLCGVVFSV